MRAEARTGGKFLNANHQCKFDKHYLGPDGRYTTVHIEQGNWRCKKCRHILVDKWMSDIETDLRGSVLFALVTTLRGNDLSAMIRRNIKKAHYFCAHFIDGALVFSNAKFMGSKARNKKLFLREIENILKSGKVENMSRDKKSRKKKNHKKTAPWSFAYLRNKDLLPEYKKCKNDFEIGLFLLKHLETPDTLETTKLGDKLLSRIQNGKINAETPYLLSTLKAVRRSYLREIAELIKILSAVAAAR